MASGSPTPNVRPCMGASQRTNPQGTHLTVALPPSAVQLAQLKTQASRAFAMKNYDQATKLWSDALNLGPSDEDVALIRNNMAACHMVKKRWNMAVQECSVALSKQPDYVKALMRRGKAYESMKDYVKAAGDYEKVGDVVVVVVVAARRPLLDDCSTDLMC